MTAPAVLHAPAAERPPLIELDRASVVRGQVRVLHELSLRIDQGQHTAILGANGCGKSTLIKLVTRELYPLARTGGSAPVQVLGQVRWQVDRLRSQLGIVTGDFGATLADMPRLTAEEAVLSGLFASFVVPPFREITDEMRQRAAEALERAGACTPSCPPARPAASSSPAPWSTARRRCCSTSRAPAWTWSPAATSWRCCARWPRRA